MAFYLDLSEEDKWLVDDPDGDDGLWVIDTMDDDDFGGLVAEGDGCPNCGERRVDCLERLEDAEHDVHCLTCGTEYDLVTEPDVDARREDYYLAGLIPPKPLI